MWRSCGKQWHPFHAQPGKCHGGLVGNLKSYLHSAVMRQPLVSKETKWGTWIFIPSWQYLPPPLTQCYGGQLKQKIKIRSRVSQHNTQNVQDRILKITHYTKNQKNLNLNEKRHSTNVNTNITQMLKLRDKDFKGAIIKMSQWATINTLETNEKVENIS